MRFVYFTIILYISCFFYSCNIFNRTPSFIEVSGFIQGTTYRVVAEHKDNVNLQKSIDSIFASFDSVFNNYVPYSLISRVNNNDSTVVIHDDFLYLLEKSRYFYEITDGAFDITMAPLANAWGFGYKNDTVLPDKQTIDSLLQFVGMEKIRIENNKIYKQKPHVAIIGNAIAKGYSTDVIAEFLLSHAITNFLVDVGGEMRVYGNNPQGKMWNVGINTPLEGTAYDEYSVIVSLENKSIATSGNYRKFYMKDGEKYAHTIHPKTGYPVSHNLLSASIITDKCIDADALATACMVVGLEKAIEIIDAHPQFQAVFYYYQQDSLYTYISKDLEQYIVHK
ncbi:MAG: FAD:protein FMN transferase [Bacteroidales bacterium]|nr:FAD:protein FMN transferase [Bacteroidales bacterium]NLK80604.1 FAD:protein FMN transferase [Bacteroidales bacterium]